MKIACALFKYFPFGGLQNDFLRVAQELVRLGHTLVCYCGEWNGEMPVDFKVELVPLRSKTNHGRAVEFEKRFHEFTAGGGFDVTVAFNRISGTDYYFAADDCLARSMAKKHSKFVLELLPRYRTFLRMEKAIFAPSSKTKIMYISEQQKRDYQSFYGTPGDRFRYLPPGINPTCVRSHGAETVRERKRGELGIADDEFMLLLVATQFQLKGADRAMEAIAQLRNDIRSKCRLVLVGDSKGEKFNNLASKLGIADNVRIFGGRKDINEFMLAADLMVHPARQEAAGSVIAESLAAGTPVICTDVCGFASFAANAECPLLNDPYDEKQLIAILENLLDENGAELAKLHKKVLDYGAKTDFCARTSKTCTIVLNLPTKN